MSPIRYRDAISDDAPTIAALFERSFTETFGHLYKPEDLETFLSGFHVDAWRGEIADPGLSIRVAEAGDTLAGYAKVGPVSLPVEPSGPAAELRQLYILSDFHGAGIAQELMTWVLDEARRRAARELFLSVYVDNHRAKRFYDRYGFAFVKPYAFMVGNHADEDLIMRLPLDI